MVIRILSAALLLATGACATLPGDVATRGEDLSYLYDRTEVALQKMVMDLSDPETPVSTRDILADIAATRALATVSFVRDFADGTSTLTVSRNVALGICQDGVQRIDILLEKSRPDALRYAQGDFSLSCLAALASLRTHFAA